MHDASYLHTPSIDGCTKPQPLVARAHEGSNAHTVRHGCTRLQLGLVQSLLNLQSVWAEGGGCWKGQLRRVHADDERQRMRDGWVNWQLGFVQEASYLQTFAEEGGGGGGWYIVLGWRGGGGVVMRCNSDTGDGDGYF